MFAQQIEVQVRAERGVGHWWIRGCNHLRPGSNMFLVDVFDRVLESKLKCDVRANHTIMRATSLTLAAVEVMKS